jgi:hypothetical protein
MIVSNTNIVILINSPDFSISFLIRREEAKKKNSPLHNITIECYFQFINLMILFSI